MGHPMSSTFPFTQTLPHLFSSQMGHPLPSFSLGGNISIKVAGGIVPTLLLFHERLFP